MRQKAKLTILAAAAWLTFACGPSQAETSDWVPISTSAARIAWDGPGLEGTLRQHIEAEIEGFSEVERAIWQDRFAVPRLSITFIALPPNRTFVSGHVPELDSQIRAWFAAAPSVQVELPGGSAGAPRYAQWQTRRFRIANPDGHCLAFRQFFGGTAWYDYLQGNGLEDGQGLGTRSLFGWACSSDPRDMDISRITGCITVEPYIRNSCGHPLAPTKEPSRDAGAAPANQTVRRAE
ncbi:MAG: hypothetical protein HOH66_06390 [Rhodospirillaceae bacterium]|nr:hypothetical protein [Rhodospirillaceae bacterium]